MTASYKLIHNRRNRTDKEGKAAVELRITVDRYTRYVATGIKLAPELWNKEKGEVRKTHQSHVYINHILNTYVQKAKNYEYKLIAGNKYYTARDLCNVFNEKNKETIYFPDWCVKMLDDDSRLRESTKKKNKSVLAHLQRFNPKLKFSEINYEFFINFHKYLKSLKNQKTEKSHTDSTIYGQIKVIKKYVKLAYLMDLIPKVPEYEMPSPKLFKEALSAEEVKRIENLNFKHEPGLERSKDLFLFSCYTAMRFSDVIKISTNNLHEKNRLIYVSVKTNTKTELPLDKLFDGKPLKLIDKYSSEKSDTIFSAGTNQSVNRHLKIIRLAANIEKPLTFHISRHTCLTLLGKSTGNPYLVMKIGGISDIKTSMRYTKGVVDDDLFDLIPKM